MQFANAQLDVGRFFDVEIESSNPDIEFRTRTSSELPSPPEFDFQVVVKNDASELNFDTELERSVLSISQSSRAGAVSLSENGLGVGLGTAFGAIIPPEAPLHVRNNGSSSGPFEGDGVIIAEATGAELDRVMLNLINNGGNFLNLQDTSLTPASNWQIFTKNDAFFLRKAGPAAAGMNIRSTGSFAFTFGGQSNFTLKPNGDAFFRGSVRSLVAPIETPKRM